KAPHDAVRIKKPCAGSRARQILIENETSSGYRAAAAEQWLPGKQGWRHITKRKQQANR
ncbi:hypothetical protein MTO96_039781, partial [Rhipicephalus appendiculatus]